MKKLAGIIALTTIVCINTYAAEKPSPLSISFPPNNGIQFSSGNNWTQISGYFQGDFVHYNGNTKDDVHNTNNLTNGFFIPSARVNVIGEMQNVWRYRFEYDFATSDIKNAFLQYMGWKKFTVKAGEYKPAFNAESMIDRVNQTFIEASLPSQTFYTGSVIGTEGLFHMRYFSVAAGIFGPSALSDNNITVNDNAPIGANTRVVLTPFSDNKKTIALQLADYWRQAASFQTRFRSIPEMQSNTGNVYLIDTSVINQARDFNVADAGAVGVWNSWSAEAEYYLATVNRTQSLSNLTFDGYSIEVNYFLTGEHRLYDALDSKFIGISKVNNRGGAWQIGLRNSDVDLNSANIVGGRENDTTLALNWYPIQRIKCALNYIYADATPSGNGLNRHANIIGVMMQVNF